VRSQEVEEDKKRLAQELILGWTHTKVKEVSSWRRTRRSLSWAGPIPRLERSGGGGGQKEVGSRAYYWLDPYQGEESEGGG
jgi:hypothetical protein